MMGHIADLSDLGQSVVPLLAWQDHTTSLVLLQLSVISGFFLAFLSPLIPWRYVLLFVGEGLLFVGHPISQSLLHQATPFFASGRSQITAKLGKLMRDDALSDEDLDRPIVSIEKFELERLQEAGHFVAESWICGELHRGYKWIDAEGWVVDCNYESGGVDRGMLLLLSL